MSYNKNIVLNVCIKPVAYLGIYQEEDMYWKISTKLIVFYKNLFVFSVIAYTIENNNKIETESLKNIHSVKKNRF